MHRRDALKGLAGAVASQVMPSTPIAWPDRVTVGETPHSKYARPYLNGKRVYGGIDGSQSGGWIRVMRMEPDNHTAGCKAVGGYEILYGRLEFRTVNRDGSWPD